MSVITELQSNISMINQSSLGHIFDSNSKLRSVGIPQDLNLLKFKNQDINQKLEQALVCDALDSSKFSGEFKNRLFIFYLFITIHACYEITLNTILMMQERISFTKFCIYILGSTTILTVGYTILFYLMNKLHEIYNSVRNVFTFYFLFISVYFSITNPNLLDHLLDKNENIHSLTSLTLICYLVLFRTILYSKFFSILLVTSLMILFLLITLLVHSRDESVYILSEFILFSGFSILQLFLSYQEDMQLRAMF